MKQGRCSGVSLANAGFAPRSIFGEMMIFICSWIGLALLTAPMLSPSPVHFLYNASDSVPRGLYVLEPASGLRAGDLVVVRPEREAAALAAHRQYLPIGVPLIKPVVAVAPQHVCVDAAGVRVDGEWVAAVLAADTHGRPLTAWSGCRQLENAEVFVLSTHPASFDSRYFGPISATQVLGKAHALGNWRSS
jgi:conjugative transfer signal peptidase TraF